MGRETVEAKGRRHGQGTKNREIDVNAGMLFASLVFIL